MTEEWFYVSDKIPNEESMLLLARKTVNNNKQALIGYYKNGKFERFNERTGLMETIDSVYAWKFIDLPEIKEDKMTNEIFGREEIENKLNTEKLNDLFSKIEVEDIMKKPTKPRNKRIIDFGELECVKKGEM